MMNREHIKNILLVAIATTIMGQVLLIPLTQHFVLH